jgi:hypothetical protein
VKLCFRAEVKLRVGAEVEAIAHLQEATVGNGLADDTKLGPIHVRVDRDNGGGGGCGLMQAFIGYRRARFTSGFDGRQQRVKPFTWPHVPPTCATGCKNRLVRYK